MSEPIPTYTLPLRKIGEVRAELRYAKRELAAIIRSAGDDMGCDGTGVEADAWRTTVACLELELAALRNR